ncbi:peptidoglycan editing factor PgeF [Telmatobacter sp. DSM 110680]|uniref:Purine nucleoside phosphorylase n=1 Tax=Telmatobacter sp. DSM 110680 TaxID=3036704 RepID=A0AAU7DJ23_9BACT
MVPATIELVKQSIPTPRIKSNKSDENVRPIDDLIKVAGLVRNRRNSAPGITSRLRRLRQETASGEELFAPTPVPDVLGSGVGLLKVTAWRDRKSLSKWLWHGFSTRVGGVSRAYATEDAPGELNLGFTAADGRDAVMQNRRLLAEAVTGSSNTPIVTLRQFHSSLVVVAGKGDADRERPCKADGVITAEPGVLIAIQTADCIPVLVADRKRRVVAGFHAGWRGTVKRIVEVGVGRMRLEFGSQPEDLIAAIGPGVGQCCYAVGEEVLSEFESQFSYARELFREVFDSDQVRKKYPLLFLTQRAPGHSPIGPAMHLDLIEANRRQLLDAGLKVSAISTTGGCTSCHTELFFSHRASHGHAGRMMSVIGMRG